MDGSAGCDPGNCVVGHESTVSWNVTAGSTWYIVVDGFEGDAKKLFRWIDSDRSGFISLDEVPASRAFALFAVQWLS